MELSSAVLSGAPGGTPPHVSFGNFSRFAFLASVLLIFDKGIVAESSVPNMRREPR